MDYAAECSDIIARLENKDPYLSSNEFIEKLHSLLPFLGHESGQVRDEIVWATLCKYFHSNLFPQKYRKQFLEMLSSADYLIYKIEKGISDDSVKRAFSVLSISDIIWGDNNPISPKRLN